MKIEAAKKILKKKGIKTWADLDEKIPGYISRYKKLVALVGADAADWMMHELSIQQCTKSI